MLQDRALNGIIVILERETTPTPRCQLNSLLIVGQLLEEFALRELIFSRVDPFTVRAIYAVE